VVAREEYFVEHRHLGSVLGTADVSHREHARESDNVTEDPAILQTDAAYTLKLQSPQDKGGGRLSRAVMRPFQNALDASGQLSAESFRELGKLRGRVAELSCQLSGGGGGTGRGAAGAGRQGRGGKGAGYQVLVDEMEVR